MILILPLKSPQLIIFKKHLQQGVGICSVELDFARPKSYLSIFLRHKSGLQSILDLLFNHGSDLLKA